MELEGQLALITGGGAGIGRDILERFVEEGAHVVSVQRRPLDSELSTHDRVHSIEADLTDVGSLAGIVDQVADLLGGLDILVNNAGMMFERHPVDITTSEWDTMMALNVRTPMFLTQAALPHFRTRGGGAVVNIGSIEGIGSNPGHAAYSASKAAVHGLTRGLAIDLGDDGIRANAIAPGWIDSALSDTYIDSFADPEAALSEITRLHPVGHTGQPRDVGDAAVFLAGPHARFLTGETLVVDGGRTVQLPTPAQGSRTVPLSGER